MLDALKLEYNFRLLWRQYSSLLLLLTGCWLIFVLFRHFRIFFAYLSWCACFLAFTVAIIFLWIISFSSTTLVVSLNPCRPQRSETALAFTCITFCSIFFLSLSKNEYKRKWDWNKGRNGKNSAKLASVKKHCKSFFAHKPHLFMYSLDLLFWTNINNN